MECLAPGKFKVEFFGKDVARVLHPVVAHGRGHVRAQRPNVLDGAVRGADGD